MAEEAGGRMIALSDHAVLVTLGDLGHTGIVTGSAVAQRDDTQYGKMILIDLDTRDWRAYTKGHRNPQGLARASDGTIYSTEHGPNGGDELNLIVEGGNYGWPLVSYGRTCNDVNECTDKDGLYLRNPLNQHLGSHNGFIRPLMSWLPSIGVSNLVVVKGTQFSNWTGDLLVSSLKAQTLYRVRLDEGRAIYAEPVFSAGRRLRDIVEMNDGTIALKTESGPLILLTAKVSRTESIVATCAGCHSFLEGQASALGPNLWGVVGRKVASRDDFSYSSALSRVEGNWSKQSLREFLLDPQAYAPGTSMQPVTMTEEDADAMIEFLANLTD
jgi:glucose/arabinose dehydrogenase